MTPNARANSAAVSRIARRFSPTGLFFMTAKKCRNCSASARKLKEEKIVDHRPGAHERLARANRVNGHSIHGKCPTPQTEVEA